MPSDKKPEFVVTDRRKFTLDGEVRPDVPETKDEDVAPVSIPAPEPPKAAAPPPPPPAPQKPKAEAAKPAKQQAPPPPPETGYNGEKQRSAFGGEKIEFIHLIDLLVQTAMMYAGAMETGPERRVDVVGLRQMIDMLGILEEKTKGNLSGEEQTMLSNVIFQLRMTYMEIINMIEKQATQAPPAANPFMKK